MSAKLDPELFPEPNLKLFDDFSPLDRKSWEEKILKDLKNPEDPEKALQKLNWKTRDGIILSPFYLSDEKPAGLEKHLPGEFPYLRGIRAQGNVWLTEQTIDFSLHHNESDLDALLEEFYKHELGSIRLLVNDASYVGHAAQFCEKIDLNRVSVNLDLEVHLKDAQPLLKWAATKDANKVLISVDPLARYLRTGAVETSTLETELREDLDATAAYLEKDSRPFLGVSGHLFRYAGANNITQLSLTLSLGSFYISALLDRGLSLASALRATHVRSAVSSSFFPEVAQLRAARYLWSQIASAYANEVSKAGSETGDWKAAAALYQSTETSVFELSALDPYTNLLRSTTQSISAVLGGSQRHTVHPFHLITDREDAFSRRMARNIQNLIRHESYLQQVADPGGGAYYLEKLTDELGSAAFQDFQNLEQAGGFLEGLKSGSIQKNLAEQLSDALKNVSSRRSIYVGVNQYPSLKEDVKEKRYDPYTGHWVNGVQLESDDAKGKAIAPVRFGRATSGFEDLRIHFQSVAASKGFRPQVLLVPAGKLAMQRARAAFSQNFLGCAGFAVEDPGSLGEVSSAAEFLKDRIAKDSSIVALTLCSSDEEYEALADAVLPIASEKGLPVIVAGSPENRDALESKGVIEFIHLKSNVFGTLVELQKRILGSSVGSHQREQ
ncbi:MAG TPA: hypothetical protein DEA96_07105 [Leptospiraceae bacterium]|nr:hypothetical protein [Spirochaetaceae bacterium]HBS04713.1 hypothetical protein [Leptospiraceae bacterium]|tara:strand:+ start:4933 stop:6936 length:2004 start_codon:yes stop_codon:yes gene_type:complete